MSAARVPSTVAKKDIVVVGASPGELEDQEISAARR